MRRIPATRVLRLSALLLATSGVLPLHATTLAHFSSQRFGSATDEAGQAVAVDGFGNVFVTGSFTGTVDFGGGNRVSSGFDDIFLAKYNSSGVHQWSQKFGSTSGDIGYAVAVDGSGNVFVTGSFTGTVDFGGGNRISAGLEDIFLAKYNASGVHQWSQKFGSTSSDVGNAVAVDGSGNVIVAGSFQGTVDFGGGNRISAGATDIFLAKYNTSGVHQWSQRFGSTSGDIGYDVAVDGTDNVLLTGLFSLTVDFGGGGGGLISAGSSDITLAMYNASGVHQWSQRFGSTNSDIGHAVAVDGSGNVIVTGSFQGTADFGGGGLVSAGAQDIFLAKYNAGGVHEWSHQFGNAASDIGYDVAVDGHGNVLFTGLFALTVDFGGGGLVSAGSFEIFLAKYSASGVYHWSERIGSTGDDRGNAVAVDQLVHFVATGYFTGTVDFGNGTLTSAGGRDIYLAKYGANAAGPLITSVADIGNDQGRQARVSFLRSGHDDPASAFGVSHYDVFRRIDALLAAPTTPSTGSASSPDRLMLEGWDYVGSTPAYRDGAYNVVVPTLADSTIADGMHYSVLFVRAGTGDSDAFFDSSPDSGYSLDNLAPGVPQGFAYSVGVLNWVESTATDFDYFTVYGSNTSSFGSSTLIDYTVSPTLDVNASPYTFYFVTATDFSGNEGKPGVINTLSGTGGTPKNYVLSISSYPNPFNPETTVRYTVPASGSVTIEVFDARGAHVATLVDQEVDAGAYTVRWNGHDDRGNPAGSGVYFGKITSAAGARSYKMTLLK